jgi:hypothetical protein
MNSPTNLHTTKTPVTMQEGTIHKTALNGNLEVTRYCNSENVTIRFIGYDHEVKTTAGNIRKGKVKNLMLPAVYGVGYIGVGDYSFSRDKKAGATWNNILTRCYSEVEHKRRPTYIGCAVIPEWLNFQNFAEWFYDTSNYQPGLYIDKDLKVQGNKVYGPDTCLFVTPEVNQAVLMSDATRGACKLGVCLDSSRGLYVASVKVSGKKKFLGRFKDENTAHETYKIEKYAQLRLLAAKQESEVVRKSLLNWVIPEY